MSVTYYPAYVTASDGSCAVEVPCLDVREVAPTIRLALTRATAELQDRVDCLVEEGRDVPSPEVKNRPPEGYTLATFVPALTPEDGLLVSVQVPFELVSSIDAVAEDRQEFVIEAIRRSLATMRMAG